MTYPTAFLQGLDYGSRSGTLGIGFHMAEGGDGTDGWLAQRSGESLTNWRIRVSGVSCHVVIESTGRRVQMVKFGNAAGNLNPDDRAGEYGYYGHHHLVDVLGSHWTNPNEWSVTAELCGFRADGPTRAQVESAVEWGEQMKDLYPSIRGTFGHHDQSPKGCPGTTPNMKEIFTRLGGHGLWVPGAVEETIMGLKVANFKSLPEGSFARVKPGLIGVKAVQVEDTEMFGVVAGDGKPVVGEGTLLGDPLGADAPGANRHEVFVIGGPGVELAVFLKYQVNLEVPTQPVLYTQAQVDTIVTNTKSRARIADPSIVF